MSLTGENIGENVGEGGQASFLVPPTSVLPTAITHNSISLEFIESPKGSAIGYRVIENAGGAAVATAPYDTDTITVTGLLPETSYTLYVVTYNETSESALSNSAQAQTSAEPVDPPLPTAGVFFSDGF